MNSLPVDSLPLPPIFVVGPTRSGTTLMRWILDSHPDISCGSELGFLAPFVRVFTKKFLRSPTGEDFDRDKLALLAKASGIPVDTSVVVNAVRRFHESFYLDIAARAGKRRWADNTHAVLDSSVAAIDVIYGRRPSYIIMVRHPLDSAISALEMVELSGEKPVAQRQQILRQYLRYWTDVVDLHCAFEDAHHGRCFHVRYEDLVFDPARQIDAMWDFLGVPTVANIEKTVFERQHAPGVGDYKIYNTRSFHSSSVGKWRRFDLKFILDEREDFGRLMERCGYPAIRPETLAH